MSDIRKIGHYISFLRKNKNMTQGQLAEKLSVSHQAVSNWERGEALPDISLLVKLAKALNTTCDRILLSGEEPDNDMQEASRPVGVLNPDITSHRQEGRTTASNNDTGMHNKGSEDGTHVRNCDTEVVKRRDRIRELENTIGILKEKRVHAKSRSSIDHLQELVDSVQEQIDDLQEELDEIQEDEEEEVELDGLESLAGLEGLKAIAGRNKLPHPVKLPRLPVFVPQHIEKGGQQGEVDKQAMDTQESNWDYIMSMAPFASQSTLKSLIEKLDDKAEFEKIIQLAPFLDSGVIEKMVFKALEDGSEISWENVTALAPFASSSTMDSLAARLEEKAELHKVIQLAPFLSAGTIERLIVCACKNGGEWDWNTVVSLAPFASSAALDILLENIGKEGSLDRLVQLAPFLSECTLEGLVSRSDVKASLDTIRCLAPFLKQETLDRLIRQSL